MKKIILVRHAQSPIEYANIIDFDRPLNNKGVLEAELMSNKIKKFISKVDVIISSGANRALSTSGIIAANINFNSDDIIIDDNIYNSSIDYMLSLIYSIPNKHEIVMLFGHNPTFHRLSQLLVKERIHIFPTCAMFGIKFNVNSWTDIDKGIKDFMIYPDSLK